MAEARKKPEPSDVRRRRLAYRAAHRGTKEMDLVLGGYVQKFIRNMSAADLDELERIVTLPDNDLARWMTGEAVLPPEFDTKLMASILAFSYKPADYS